MRDYLLATCVGFPDEVRRVLGNIRSDDFVFTDVIAQIEMPRIAKGRCALVGDAAHCPTFLSGMGSSLALQDAHILAGCLARSPGDIGAAFSRYEEVVTPIARRYRQSALNARRVILGRGRIQTHLRDLALRVMPERLLERGIRRFVDAERPLVDVPSAAAMH
jgi:2-polyprenyl-6-methoxyphenol hydroxylase-like FAD-dependent oxidoreductase